MMNEELPHDPEISLLGVVLRDLNNLSTQKFL